MNKYLILSVIQAAIVVTAATAAIGLLFGAWAAPAFVLMSGALFYDFWRRLRHSRRTFDVDSGAINAASPAEVCPVTNRGQPSHFHADDYGPDAY